MRPGVPPLQLRLPAFKSDSCSFHLKLCSWLLDVARAGPGVAWEVKGPRGTEHAVPAREGPPCRSGSWCIHLRYSQATVCNKGNINMGICQQVFMTK